MKTDRSLGFLAAISLVLIAMANVSRGADAYYDIPFDHLTLTEGAFPPNDAKNDFSSYGFRDSMRSYAVLDGPGEAFSVSGFEHHAGNAPADHIAIRAPEGQDVTGRLFVEKKDAPGMVVLKFKVRAAEAKADAKEIFYRTMENHYEDLMGAGLPGGAWFRHRVSEAKAAVGNKPLNPPEVFRANRPATLDDTFSIFSGNQALTENLQLDKALPPSGKDATKEVAVDSIEGITVAQIDWKPYIKDKHPAIDKLAQSIPADQHAILFRDFSSLIAMADEADKYGTPLLQLAETRSEDAQTRARFEKQLGLSLSGLGRLLGPTLVSHVAITGSDPYLRMGSDIAILFEPKGDALKALLEARLEAARQMVPGAKAIPGAAGAIVFSGVESPNRELCSYLTTLKNGTIVITNSKAQLQRFADVESGKSPALASTPEFIFFRDRYALDAPEESAFLVLTDATIRRWCGPRWRIADSRRTRAAAVLSDLNARYLDRLVAGKQEAAVVSSEFSVPDFGEINLRNDGAASSTYGSLEFLTPISELKLDRVMEAEAESYKRWRDTYQTNWRGVFDPIAVRFTVQEKKLAADMTVMPLIYGSEYRPMIDIATGAKIDPARSDMHAALLRVAMAININAAQIKAASMFAMSMAPAIKVDPLGWVGQSIWIYADDDPFWEELVNAKDSNKFFESNFHRMPVALQVEVSSGLKLTAFLVALHGFIDQSAPGMTIWENLTYKDQPYVKITPSAAAKGQSESLKDAALFYRATGDMFLVTPNEALLKRAVDRQLDRDAAKKAGKEMAQEGPSLLGESLVYQIDAKVFDFFQRGTHDEVERFMEERSWGNLPILNEFKRRYPDQDPLQIYAKFFHARLIDPAGGQYQWNEKWQTMESTLYGSPAEPKKGPDRISVLTGLLRANYGLTFENEGLRARGEIEREAKK